MEKSATPDGAKSQLDKFKDLARELGADEDEARWDDRLKKLANATPTRLEGGDDD